MLARAISSIHESPRTVQTPPGRGTRGARGATDAGLAARSAAAAAAAAAVDLRQGPRDNLMPVGHSSPSARKLYDSLTGSAATGSRHVACELAVAPSAVAPSTKRHRSSHGCQPAEGGLGDSAALRSDASTARTALSTSARAASRTGSETTTLNAPPSFSREHREFIVLPSPS